MKTWRTFRSLSRGAAAVLTAATSGLSLVHDPRLVRQRFEEQVRALVCARSVALRDEPGDGPRPPNTITLDLPGATTEYRARIEAVFETAHRPDGWTRHVLEAGAHVAALLLELERAHERRFPRPHYDGAAPLIGSSPAIQQVRKRIERVAATDFTVLVKGASGPQPHPDFVDVFSAAAPDDGEGKVEGAGEASGLRAVRRQSRCGWGRSRA
jgi:hypothetical protein